MGLEDLPKGTLIGGRYDIRDRLGRGGMGTVYRAFDNKVGGTVALKLGREGRRAAGMSRDDREKRFAREILAINQVDHPNVVRIEDFGFYKGAPYMVMQLLTGKDLAAVLREHGGPFSVEHAVDVVVSICVVIRACHEANVVHRDLKPENVMIVKRDVGLGWEAKIVDFGIAKLDDADHLTQEGRIVGTPAYLAPEQISGKPGPASDQYAIGVLLYLCLTGVHPFGDFSGLPLIRAIEKGVFKNPREHRGNLAPELASIACKAMHLDPAQRYDNVFELGRTLRPFCSALGQQLWKNYYDTPPIRRSKIDAKASAVGVPLVRHIADRGGGAAGAQTALAHYESTTGAGSGTVPDGAAPIAGGDMAVERMPVTEVLNPSSATAVDLTLPAPSSPKAPRADAIHQSGSGVSAQGGTKSFCYPRVDAVHPSGVGDSALSPVKGPAPRVVITLMIVGILGGAGAWFFTRGGPRPGAPVLSGQVAAHASPPLPALAPSPAPRPSASAVPGPRLHAPNTEGGAGTVADVNRAEAPDEGDQINARAAHHRHRRISAEAHRARPGDGRSATALLAAADASFARGDYGQAGVLGREAIRKNGGADAYLIVGDASFRSGDFATARAMYGEVLKRNPASDLVRRRMEMLAAKEKQATNRGP